MNQTTERLSAAFDKMDRQGACESVIHLVVATICHNGQHLQDEQKADILSAALLMHRCVTAYEVLRILTTAHSECDLLRPGDDAAKAMMLRDAVAGAIVKAQKCGEEVANRFFNLTEMLFEAEAADVVNHESDS